MQGKRQHLFKLVHKIEEVAIMKMKKTFFITFILMLLLTPVTAFAADGSAIDTGDTAFSILSIALVFIMTPGLAFFYGGMVRRKNVLNTMMNSFSIIGIISIQWVLFGYTLAFGPDVGGGLLGGFNFLGFNGVGADPYTLIGAANHIPHAAFAMFQLMFAIITPALITGAFAERMRFGAFAAFVFLWATIVYDPLCHWVWGPGGWLSKLGVIDFAGGTVVHISSGIAGLVCALVLGKRKGYKTSSIVPHNIPFVVLGAGLLWFGWFGFNAGSSLHADGLALSAFVVTNTAAAAALISWMIVEAIHRGKPTVLGAATGAVVGLVAITPAAGSVNPMAAIIIGLVVSPLCYIAISFVKSKFGYDDSLDAFGCHGVGGMWGALATGIFANANGATGLFTGNPGQVLKQLAGILVTVAFSGIASFAILKVISLFTPLRVAEQDENDGLDVTQHGEDAYPDFSSDDGVMTM